MNLSIVIPVFNGAPFIQRCLDSIIQQDKNNLVYEIICINDGSVDNSFELLKNYSFRFNNIKIFNQKNQGSGEARNVGIKNALGKYIWFVDVDDFIEQNSLKILENIVLTQNFDAINFCNYEYVSKNQKSKIKNGYSRQTVNGLELISKYKRHCYLWNNLYLTECIVNNNLKFINNIKNIEDYEFNIRFFYYSKSVLIIPNTLYNYCENLTSTSRNNSRENILKLATDSYVVHNSIKKFEQQVKEENKANQIVSELLAKSIVGFFYSLFRNNYTFEDLKNYYSIYKENKLLPIKLKTSNFKYYVFKKFVNNKKLFLQMSYFKKLNLK